MNKTHNLKVSVTMGVLATMLCGAALAAEGKWTEGYGQGNLEYFIDAKGVQLHVGCPTQDGDPDSSSTVSLFVVNSNKPIAPFTLTVDGHTFRGPIDASSRVDSDNFRSLIGGLRRGDAVVRYGQTTITFPKANAEKVLPAPGKKFLCNTLL